MPNHSGFQCIARVDGGGGGANWNSIAGAYRAPVRSAPPPAYRHSVFTARMVSLSPNQQVKIVQFAATDFSRSRLQFSIARAVTLVRTKTKFSLPDHPHGVVFQSLRLISGRVFLC